ncbi:unnamed protein product [Allacma fusca]|uniref:Uncharacterized protein n=1 Tax=Allacma fusca TaxID=39272 RepID=A0A8J2LI43_9HEXA|nr:unnamed protein product [Allacma fusca]
MESINYTEVTEDNVGKFNWTGQRSISINKFLTEIPAEKINKCRDSVVNLKFESAASTKNIKAFLRACPHLQRLTFVDVLVDEYRRFKEDKPIDHPNVTHLIIKSSTNLAKKEHWLIDFFFWRINFRNLQSFRVQKIFTGNSGGLRITTNAYMEKFGQQVETNIVTQFLIKNRFHLKELELGGSGLYVSDILSLQNPPAEMGELDKLTLSTLIFSLDADGIPAFLQTQSHLTELKCSHIFTMGILGHHLDIPYAMSTIFSCIDRNCMSLTEITIYPIMIIDVSRQTLLEQDLLGMFTINCECFSQCYSLRILRLGLHAYRQEQDLAKPGMATLMGTRLINLHLIPIYIQELYLPVEEYSHDELEALAFQFSKFTKLISFYFGTSQLNPVNSFLIRLPWLQSLFLLPDIQRIEFHNGKLEDPDATRALIETKPNGSTVTLRQNFPRFTFEIGRKVNSSVPYPSRPSFTNRSKSLRA